MQRTHPVCPVAGCTHPPSHGVHAGITWALGLKKPFAHGDRVVAPPTNGHSWPAGQTAHAVPAPPFVVPCAAHRPEAHAAHCVWLFGPSNFPCGHLMHVLLPLLTIHPVGQSAHPMVVCDVEP